MYAIIKHKLQNAAQEFSSFQRVVLFNLVHASKSRFLCLYIILCNVLFMGCLKPDKQNQTFKSIFVYSKYKRDKRHVIHHIIQIWLAYRHPCHELINAAF